MADIDDAAEVADEVIDAPESGAVEQEGAPELSEVETLAVEMGWTPKSAWKGEEADWKPAPVFIKATKDINRNLSRDLKDVKRQVEGIARTSAAMTDRAVAEARTKWEAELDRAVDEGDRDAARQARKELSTLDRQQTTVSAPAEGQQFAEKHSAWFNKDAEATTYAVNRAQHYADQGLSPARQLAAVEKDMRGLFPDLFPDEEQREPRKPPPSLGTPNRTARPAAREKGYATLPPEARKACDNWVKQNEHRGAWVTKDSWASSYYEEAANG